VRVGSAAYNLTLDEAGSISCVATGVMPWDEIALKRWDDERLVVLYRNGTALVHNGTNLSTNRSVTNERSVTLNIDFDPVTCALTDGSESENFTCELFLTNNSDVLTDTTVVRLLSK